MNPITTRWRICIYICICHYVSCCCYLFLILLKIGSHRWQPNPGRVLGSPWVNRCLFDRKPSCTIPCQCYSILLHDLSGDAIFIFDRNLGPLIHLDSNILFYIELYRITLIQLDCFQFYNAFAKRLRPIFLLVSAKMTSLDLWGRYFPQPPSGWVSFWYWTVGPPLILWPLPPPHQTNTKNIDNQWDPPGSQKTKLCQLVYLSIYLSIYIYLSIDLGGSHIGVISEVNLTCFVELPETGFLPSWVHRWAWIYASSQLGSCIEIKTFASAVFCLQSSCPHRKTCIPCCYIRSQFDTSSERNTSHLVCLMSSGLHNSLLF